MKKILILSSLFAFLFCNVAFAGDPARGGPISFDTRDIEDQGTIIQLVIPLSALAYSSIIGDWEGDVQWAESVGSTVVSTQVLKWVIPADRPIEADGTRGQSFPSGHTSFAFAGAGYWQRRYGWGIGAPMYVAASYVAYSRVRARDHNWSDVIGGAAIGIGFNYLFTDRYNDESTHISVSPTAGGAYLGFSTKF
jgi:membrane-associated phospholipid phosphatase